MQFWHTRHAHGVCHDCMIGVGVGGTGRTAPAIMQFLPAARARGVVKSSMIGAGGRDLEDGVGGADLDALAAGGAAVVAHAQGQAGDDRVLGAGEQAGAAGGAVGGDDVAHAPAHR
jgi:hypothetical protein